MNPLSESGMRSGHRALADLSSLETPDRQLWSLWRHGQRPDVRAFLAEFGELSAEQIAGALAVDQWERWMTGERILAERYLQDFPILATSPDAAFDLVYGEFLVREKLGEAPRPEEFVGRFPEFTDLLARQLELHQAMEPEIISEADERKLGGRSDPKLPRTLPSQSAPPVGGWPRVPGYEIVGELGQGGMAVVFQARQLSLDRDVALKLIPRNRLDADERDGVASRRLRREALALARLSHPNVVAIFDAGETEEVVYFAMEYVDGIDLQKLVDQRGPLPITDAVEYVRQAALGLQHSHEQGLVHRDIKPSNLLIADAFGSSPLVKLLDLGLARIGSLSTMASDGLTKIGTFIGTPDFAAPEQADDARRADIRSDLYSLGCTLYFLLAGRVPFPGLTPLEKLVKHRLEEAPPIESSRPDVTPAVGAIVRKLMAKRAEDRYQSPAELVHALTALRLVPQPTDSVLVSPRSRRSVSLAAAPSVVLRRTATENAPTTEGPSSLRRLLGHGDWVKAVVFTSDGRRLLTASLDRTVRLWDVAAGTELARGVGHEDGILCAALAVDGTMALTGGVDHTVRRWSLVDGVRETAVLRGHTENVNDIVFSPDGTAALSASHDGTSRLWDLATGTERMRLIGHAGPVWSAVFSPDGRFVYTCGRDATVRVWTASTGVEYRRWTGGGRQVCTLALSADGTKLATGNTDGSVIVRDAVDGRELRVLSGHAGKVNVVVFAPDGRLLSGGRDQTLRLWDSPTGQEIACFRGHSHWLTAAAVSPDGRLAASASADRAVCLWTLPS